MAAAKTRITTDLELRSAIREAVLDGDADRVRDLQAVWVLLPVTRARLSIVAAETPAA